MNVHTKGFSPPDKDELAWLGTRPIPTKPYCDPAWYADEIEAIFKRSWIQIGHVCELPQPDSYIVRELEFAGVSLLITRGSDGEVRAMHNVCTHRGTQLVDARAGTGRKFSCRYHMWTFSNDGKLIGAPDFEQFNVEKAACAIPQVHCGVVAGMIFVNLAKGPVEDLRSWLGDMAAKLEETPVANATHMTEYTYDIDANWKLTYDNFQENYHLRFIHSRTGIASIGESNPFGYPSAYGFYGPHRTQSIWMSQNPSFTPLQLLGVQRSCKAAVERGIDPVGSLMYLALFPATFVFASTQQPFSHTVYPIGPTRSRGVIRLYWTGADANPNERFAREFMGMLLRDVHSEDRTVIEAGQRGLSSGALDHIHLQTQESLIRHLFNEVEARVLAFRAEREGDQA